MEYVPIYIWLIFMINVGKYASPMDPMGTKTPETFRRVGRADSN